MAENETPSETPAEPEADPITLTDKAAEMVAKIRAEEKIPDDQYLRLKLQGGGCSGFSYDLHFDAVRPEGDNVYTIKGVKVVIDQMSLMYLFGTELDYQSGLTGAGFKFNNPNVKSTCGCGSSFSV